MNRTMPRTGIRIVKRTGDRFTGFKESIIIGEIATWLVNKYRLQYVPQFYVVGKTDHAFLIQSSLFHDADVKEWMPKSTIYKIEEFEECLIPQPERPKTRQEEYAEIHPKFTPQEEAAFLEEFMRTHPAK